jgi:hypothetical protein
MKKKPLIFGGIAIVALAIILAVVGGNRLRDKNENENTLSDYKNDYSTDNSWDYYDDSATSPVSGINNSRIDASGDKSIKITGINGISGYSTISIYDTDGSWIAHGSNSLGGDTAEYLLYDSGPGFKRFTGSGFYIVGLTFESDVWRYYYTNGETLKNLGVQSIDDISKLPRFTIESAESTILFSHFKPLDYIGAGGK